MHQICDVITTSHYIVIRQNEADEQYWKTAQWSDAGSDLFLETAEDEEERDEEDFENALLEEIETDWAEQSLETRVTDMLRQYEAEYGITKLSAKKSEQLNFG